MRMSVVSGGPSSATGVLVVDDLFVAVHLNSPTILSGNFYPNSTFENGAQLDNPTLGVPAGGWQRGGSSSGIDQMSTNGSVSTSHSLALVDSDAGNYGEWYMVINLAGLIADNDAVDIQWFQAYSTTNGAMRLSFAFLDAGNNTLFGVDNNVSGSSPGWVGSTPASPFQKQTARYLAPVGTTQLRVNLASGGASSVVGTMLVDDLSVRLSRPLISTTLVQPGSFGLTWNSMPSKNYTVQYSASLSPQAWVSLVLHMPGAVGQVSTSYTDLSVHPGKTGYYRVIQE